MSHRNVGARISAKYQQKLGKSHLNRLDLTLADHKMLDKDNTTARILVAYNPLHGEPSKSDIQRFVWSTFEAKVNPILTTARIHTSKNVVDLVVEPVRRTLAYAESKKMASVIPGKKYVDSDKGIWEVRSSEDGQTKFLVRKSEDNIDELLAERRKYVNAGAHLPTFRSLEKSAGYVNAQEGDTVEFYQGTTPMQGKVVSLGKDNKVKVSTGKVTLEIPRQAIMRVIEHSAAFKANKMKMLYEYFEKIMGPEMAKKLTQNGDNAAEGTGFTNI